MNTAKNQQETVVFQILGPFRVLNDAGVDITPRGRKACALLAILALSKNFERSRKWLQDTLWSDRAEEQGASSLRQSLAEIRRAFGPYKSCLITDRGIVALAAGHFRTEASVDRSGGVQLLEGIDAKDHQFEDWLRHTRMEYDRMLVDGAVEPERVASAKDRHFLHREKQNPRLVVVAAKYKGSPVEKILHAGLTGAIGQLLSDTNCIDVHYAMSDAAQDRNDHTGPIAILRSDVQQDGAMVHIGLHNAANEQQIWSRLISCDDSDGAYARSEKIQCGINVAANAAFDWLGKQQLDDGSSAALYIRGIKLSQRHTIGDYVAADACFKQAYDIAPSGVHLAWRAYIRSFMVAELMHKQRDELLEETRFLCATALEMDPHNSLVLSLCAHVQSTVFLSYSAAHELALQSIAINSANPLALVSLATAQSHSGQLSEAIDHCRRARRIAGTSPFRAHIDILSCIVAVMSGDFSEARHYGEAAHALAPTLAAPLRFLMPLYLESGFDEEAERHLQKLCILEPGFHMSRLRDKDYPCESLRKSTLINLLPTA